MEARIILAPYHAGSFGVRVGAGPTRLMEDGLEQALRGAGVATAVHEIERVDDFEGEIGRSFDLMRRIAIAVAEAQAVGAFPLVLAGNCNSSVGVVAGVSDSDATLVWFDAHPDFDTPDEHRSGYFDGMGVATITGQCWRNLAATIAGFRPVELDRILYCGIRDFEPGQWEKIRAFGIRAARGSKECRTDYVKTLTSQLEELSFTRAMVHLDLDCLDTTVGRANDYAAPGGLSADDLLRCLACVYAKMRPLSLTIASFDPELEGPDRICATAIDAAVLTVAAATRRP